MLKGAFLRAKQRLKAWPPAVLASEIRWSVKNSLRDFHRHRAERVCIHLKPDEKPRGAVLLSYMLDGFLSRPDRVPYRHTSYWESREMARTFLELGYEVDVISFQNRNFVPEKDYAVMIDSRHNLERLAGSLPPDCLKVFHIDSANILFHNAAEARRLLALQQRRAVTLTPRRFERPNRGIEFADCATILGNEFTANTFWYAGKPLYRLPMPIPFTYPWPKHKDWEGARTRFLFLASGGMVHKGLDVLLEAFARSPQYHLTICAPIPPHPDRHGPPNAGASGFDTIGSFLDQSAPLEAEFCRAYRKELYGMPNIEVLGWTDVASPRFRRIADSCGAIVSPSCSEGGCAAVLTGMHAGLIPIVSLESSVDVGDFGILLPTASIEDIQAALEELAAFPDGQLEERTRRAWEHVRAHHTRVRYAIEYRLLMGELLRRTPEFLPSPRSGSRSKSPGRQATRPLLTGARGASSTAIPWT